MTKGGEFAELVLGPPRRVAAMMDLDPVERSAQPATVVPVQRGLPQHLPRRRSDVGGVADRAVWNCLGHSVAPAAVMRYAAHRYH